MLSERAIEIAEEFVGKTESKLKPNWAPWLDNLFARAGNSFGWRAGMSYCMAAAFACYAAAAKELGLELPLDGSASTQTFYNDARLQERVSKSPARGDIIIFQVGNAWQGHAGIVVGCTPDSVSTIEFNTGGTMNGSQRNGEGVYMKLRKYKDFPRSDTKLWIKGFVKMSEI